MGLLDLFKRKKEPQPAEPVAAPARGWDAITAAFEALYPGQTSPAHRAPLVYRMPEDAILVVRDLAIPEPLDTPNGRVELLLLFGVQDAVRRRVLEAHEVAGGGQGWERPILAELRSSN